MGRKRQIAILAMMVWLSGCTCYKVNSDYPEPLPLKDNLELVSLHQIYTLDVDGRRWDPEDAACVRDLFGEIIRNDRRSRELGLKYPPEEIVFADKDQKSVIDIFRRLDRGQMQNMALGGSELTPILCPSSAGYVLLVKQVGFTRTGGSLVADMAKGIAIGIATMGWFYTVPILE